jgi:hypothetical protein
MIKFARNPPSIGADVESANEARRWSEEGRLDILDILTTCKQILTTATQRYLSTNFFHDDELGETAVCLLSLNQI